MPNIPTDVTNDRGFKQLESELPEDFEQLAREHKTLEAQYGEAKLQSARDLLRLTFLHQKITGRLLAQRLPNAAAEKARARVRRELKGKTKPQDLEAAQYVVLFTTVPASRLSSARCLQLYRLRWQVAFAFKRWESLCHFDRLPNYRDDSILSWLYAKLLLALLMHRMARGALPLFPQEQEESPCPSLACASVKGRQYSVACRGLRAAAA